MKFECAFQIFTLGDVAVYATSDIGSASKFKKRSWLV